MLGIIHKDHGHDYSSDTNYIFPLYLYLLRISNGILRGGANRDPTIPFEKHSTLGQKPGKIWINILLYTLSNPSKSLKYSSHLNAP